MMKLESCPISPNFIEPAPNRKRRLDQTACDLKRQRTDRTAQEIAKAMWKDFKGHIASLKPIADHMVPYSLFGAILMQAPAPYNAGLTAITMSICGYRGIGLTERAEKIQENEILVQQQQSQLKQSNLEISKLSEELQLARREIENLKLQLQASQRAQNLYER